MKIKFDKSTAKKMVDYAYKTSDTAKKYGKYDKGGFILYYLDANFNRVEIDFFDTKEDAINYGNTLFVDWHWMHLKYNVI